jgi:limonene-1,2-epoxide hydrolase
MRGMKSMLGFVVAILLCISFVQAKSEVVDRSSFMRDFYAAYAEKNADKMAHFYTVDATFVDPSFELNLKGPDQIRDLLKKALAKYETLEFQITHTISAGDELVVEGTMIGKLPKNVVRVPFVSIFKFKEGKISSQRDMFDVLHFFTQLGARMINREE